MHVGPKISGVESAFLVAWRRGCSFSYTLWRTSVIKCKSRRKAPLIFAPHVHANLRCWRTADELLAYLWREFYTVCTLRFLQQILCIISFKNYLDRVEVTKKNWLTNLSCFTVEYAFGTTFNQLITIKVKRKQNKLNDIRDKKTEN